MKGQQRAAAAEYAGGAEPDVAGADGKHSQVVPADVVAAQQHGVMPFAQTAEHRQSGREREPGGNFGAAQQKFGGGVGVHQPYRQIAVKRVGHKAAVAAAGFFQRFLADGAADAEINQQNAGGKQMGKGFQPQSPTAGGIAGIGGGDGKHQHGYADLAAVARAPGQMGGKQRQIQPKRQHQPGRNRNGKRCGGQRGQPQGAGGVKMALQRAGVVRPFWQRGKQKTGKGRAADEVEKGVGVKFERRGGKRPQAGGSQRPHRAGKGRQRGGQQKIRAEGIGGKGGERLAQGRGGFQAAFIHGRRARRVVADSG